MDVADASALVQAVAAVVGGVSTIVIAYLVYGYTSRRDKAAIIHEMWKQQQEWNLTAASSPAHARATEQMVYGHQPANEEERLALNSCMFFFINRINHIYDAYCLKILSKSEFENEAAATARLVAGQKGLLFALLDQRGYEAAFAAEMKRLVADLEITGDVNVFRVEKELLSPASPRVTDSAPHAERSPLSV